MRVLALVTLVVLSMGCSGSVLGETAASSPKTIANPSPNVPAEPSPSPTPAALPAIAVTTPLHSYSKPGRPLSPQVPQSDCTQIVYHSFTAFLGPGPNDVTLAWRVSGACAPVHGYIAGSYFSGGIGVSWDFNVFGLTGSHVDTVRRKTLSGPCNVTIGYTLVIQGGLGSAQAIAYNVYIC